MLRRGGEISKCIAELICGWLHPGVQQPIRRMSATQYIAIPETLLSVPGGLAMKQSKDSNVRFMICV